VATSTRSRKGLSFDDVREIGLKLPDTEEGTAWGTPVLRVNGHIFTGIPIHPSAEPGSLSVHCDVTTRDAMIEEQPDIYYTAAHYENYPCVLVRFSRITRDILEDLLRMSYRFVSTTRPKKRPARKRKRSAGTRRSRR
jgi:hypothetical protein